MDRTDEAPKVRKGPRRVDVSVRRMYFRKITEILRRSIKPIAKVIKWENQTPLTETKEAMSEGCRSGRVEPAWW
jgi:acyl-CoA reductase-like NAD-dependent aldehyde dehydrogenase